MAIRGNPGLNGIYEERASSDTFIPVQGAEKAKSAEVRGRVTFTFDQTTGRSFSVRSFGEDSFWNRFFYRKARFVSVLLNVEKEGQIQQKRYLVSIDSLAKHFLLSTEEIRKAEQEDKLEGLIRERGRQITTDWVPIARSIGNVSIRMIAAKHKDGEFNFEVLLDNPSKKSEAEQLKQKAIKPSTYFNIIKKSRELPQNGKRYFKKHELDDHIFYISRDKIGKVRILHQQELLGEGIHAKVYKMREVVGRSLHAVKMQRTNVPMAEVTKREMRIHKKIWEKHEVVILDKGRLLLPLAGKNAHTIFIDNRSINNAERLNCCKQLSARLAKMHEDGVIHCDIKPDNILEIDGEYHLTDFGISHDIPSEEEIAKADAEALSEFLRVAGENIRYDKRSDWYFHHNDEIAIREDRKRYYDIIKRIKGGKDGKPPPIPITQLKGEIQEFFKKHREINERQDVFAQGVSMYQILTGGQLPLGMEEGLDRPKRDGEPFSRKEIRAFRYPTALIDLLEQMLAHDPLKRPTAAEVSARMALIS